MRPPHLVDLGIDDFRQFLHVLLGGYATQVERLSVDLNPKALHLNLLSDRWHRDPSLVVAAPPRRGAPRQPRTSTPNSSFRRAATLSCAALISSSVRVRSSAWKVRV